MTNIVSKTSVTILIGAAALLAAPVLLGQENLVARGEYLTYAGGCISCHTEDVDHAVPLAGGRAMETPFGTFYSPNITPDEDTGIGGWSDDEFVNAFWEGVGIVVGLEVDSEQGQVKAAAPYFGPGASYAR